MDVPLAANILGTIGAICWSVQLIPQIVINYRRHHTDGLQPSMMLLWAMAGVPLGIYNIVSEFNIALRIQPQILTTLSLITWAQCGHYGRGWTATRCIAFTIPIALLMGGIQAALIIALRIARQRLIDWPITLMAVLSACLLAAGVLRHYIDIYAQHTVRGISFIFVGIDAAGDLFSLISVLFEPTLNILGMVIYGTELILWTGVFVCGGYFNLVPWLKMQVSRRRRVHDEQIAQSLQNTGIALHDLPSSTSVFRTASHSDGAVRRSLGLREQFDS